MGVFNIFSHDDCPFDERSIQLLTGIGNWAGLAIENARLHSRARRLAVLEERDRIGMDLHDGIIQSIYGVGLALEGIYHSVEEDPHDAKQRIQHAIDGLNQAIRDIRAYILDLRPRQLGNDGLLAGLRRLITEYRANTFSEVEFTAPRSDFKEMPHSHSLALFHICQEALANTAKHSGATKVNVSLTISGDRVQLEVHDNGRGFHIEKMTTTIGHGLSNMQSRARAVGGELDITSTPGEGTTIRAWVPRGLRA